MKSKVRDGYKVVLLDGRELFFNKNTYQLEFKEEYIKLSINFEDYNMDLTHPNEQLSIIEIYDEDNNNVFNNRMVVKWEDIEKKFGAKLDVMDRKVLTYPELEDKVDPAIYYCKQINRNSTRMAIDDTYSNREFVSDVHRDATKVIEYLYDLIDEVI